MLTDLEYCYRLSLRSAEEDEARSIRHPKKKLPFWQIQHHAYIFQNGKIFCQNGKKFIWKKFQYFIFWKNTVPFWKNILLFWKNIFQNEIIYFQNGRFYLRIFPI
jgi:hypothetical protein